MRTNRVAKNMSISFMPDMLNKINNYCAERGCSRSWFINKAAELLMKSARNWGYDARLLSMTMSVCPPIPVFKTHTQTAFL